MYNPALQHMRALFGLDPNVVPAGMQFPRLPPALMHPMTSTFAMPPRKMLRDAASLTPNLEDFQQMYQKHASQLLQPDNNSIMPPGHPLYNKQTSVTILKSENDKLLKENLDLKKQLEKTSKHN